MLATGFWMLDVKYWRLDAGCLILDFEMEWFKVAGEGSKAEDTMCRQIVRSVGLFNQPVNLINPHQLFASHLPPSVL